MASYASHIHELKRIYIRYRMRQRLKLITLLLNLYMAKYLYFLFILIMRLCLSSIWLHLVQILDKSRENSARRNSKYPQMISEGIN